MTYYPHPDEFYADPTFSNASDAAIALWSLATSWSAHHLTDGLVPSSTLPVLRQLDDTAAVELVKLGVWKRTRGGFQFVAWPKLASRAYVEAKREASRKRQENFRKSQGKQSRRDSRVSDGVSHGATNAVTNASQSSPVPLPKGREGLTTSVPAGARERAAAIAACSLCDSDGYAGTQLCDHDPQAAERAARGRALVQAALSRPTNEPEDDPDVDA